jgi:DNA-binding transcriptional LysR family regulator
MEPYNDLAAFVVVVREASFTRAAAQLGVSQSALSHTVRSLEKKLDLKLLHRTTRSVSPTEAGERLYQTVASRFADIEAELSALSELRDKPAGTVRISASEHAVHTLIWPRLESWLGQYPDIKVELCCDNGFTDIVAKRYDIGVRLGDDVAKDMIAVRIAADMRMAVVGSPAYLERRRAPQIPHDLLEHNCIAMRLATHGGLLAWEFMHDGRKVNVNVTGQLVFNDSLMIVRAALAGGGLAWLPLGMIEPHLAAVRLQSVLDDWGAVFPGYHLYYPSRRASQALALVVERLRYAERDSPDALV